MFLLLHVMWFVIDQFVPFEVKSESTIWRYDLQNLHRLLLHKVISRGAGTFGFSFESNLAVANIKVILGDCLRASSGLQLINFCFLVVLLHFIIWAWFYRNFTTWRFKEHANYLQLEYFIKTLTVFIISSYNFTTKETVFDR